MNQIERIVEITGSPSSSDVESICSPYAATMLESLPPLQHKSLIEVFPAASPEARDFINETFHFNPNLRTDSEGFLRHIYVAEFHNEEEESIYPHGPLRLAIDDNTKLTAQQYRERLYQEITNRRKESRKREQSRQRKQSGNGVSI